MSDQSELKYLKSLVTELQQKIEALEGKLSLIHI